MDKMLLTLTLVVFSSGMLCNAEQNLTDAANSTLDPMGKSENNTASAKSNLGKVCTSGDVRDDYVVIPGMGAYKEHRQPLVTWNEARKTCEDEGAQLAVINSNAEANMMMAAMNRDYFPMAWIGTYSQLGSGHWVTLNNETLAEAGYDHWQLREPTNLGSSPYCGVLVHRDGMSAVPCNIYRLIYFCKIKLC